MSKNRWELTHTGNGVNAEICPHCFNIHFDGLHYQNCGICGESMQTPTYKYVKSIKEVSGK